MLFLFRVSLFNKLLKSSRGYPLTCVITEFFRETRGFISCWGILIFLVGKSFPCEDLTFILVGGIQLVEKKSQK